MSFLAKFLIHVLLNEKKSFYESKFDSSCDIAIACVTYLYDLFNNM